MFFYNYALYLKRTGEDMWKKILFMLMVMVFTATSIAAFAKEKKKEKKIHEMVFEGDVVEAEFMHPNQGMVTVLIRKKRSLLLKPRTDFIEEIIKSAEDL